MSESIWDRSFMSTPLLNFIPSDEVGHNFSVQQQATKEAGTLN